MPLSPWVNPDDDHNGLFEKPVVVLFPNARSTSQGTFTVPPPPKHTTTHQSLCEKLKRMHLPTFIKELGPLSLLAWVNNFILYIRKEMVYSKLLSFSIMRKLRNCVSPLNVKIVRKYFAFAAFFKLSSVLTNPLKSCFSILSCMWNDQHYVHLFGETPCSLFSKMCL